MKTLADVMLGAATVALIAIATRWMFNSGDTQGPTLRDGANFYRIRWQIRVVSYLAATFFLFLSVENLLHSERWAANLFIVLAFGAVWFSSGVVVTDQTAITKKSLWKSQILRWDEISSIQVHKKDAGAIDLRAGSRRLIVDSRFVAPAHLLKDIEDHTALRAARD